MDNYTHLDTPPPIEIAIKKEKKKWVGLLNIKIIKPCSIPYNAISPKLSDFEGFQLLEIRGTWEKRKEKKRKEKQRKN